MLAQSSIPDMRSAVRFPLCLPVAVHADSGSYSAETKDISAGGVLFKISRSMEVGSSIEFTIAMPAAIIGSAKDVLVNCTGRVVRCCPESDDRCAVAAVIDEYKFER